MTIRSLFFPFFSEEILQIGSEEEDHKEQGEKIPCFSNFLILRIFPIIKAKHLSYMFVNVLSKDEKARMNAFIFENHKLQYQFCRGMLRFFLSKYIGCLPCEITFSTNLYGKPYLAHRDSLAQIKFNLSHTVDQVIIALGFDREVGVDIEKLRLIENLESLVLRYCSPIEQRYIQILSPFLQAKAFLTIWCRKEALLKAIGIGIAHGESLLSTLTCVNERTTHSLFGKNWVIHTLFFSSPHVGAVAFQKGGCKRKPLFSNEDLEVRGERSCKM